jgi:putative protein kinase ArgK-like GTPase of G3E family
MSETPKTQLVATILTNLEKSPPATLGEARTKLVALRQALHASIEETWHSTDDKASVIGNVTLRLEGINSLAAAITELEKAEAAAAAALAKVSKKLWANHLTQSVWRKLNPQATA